MEEGQEGVSDGQFAGAVAASVLLTFVFGFSAGALTRAHVLRCVQGPYITAFNHTGTQLICSFSTSSCSKLDVLLVATEKTLCSQ